MWLLLFLFADLKNIFDNNVNAISFSSFGIEYITIRDNYIGCSHDDEIASYASYVSIYNKTICNNGGDGIYVSSWTNYLIYHNIFINNSQNALDSGTNAWYSETLQEGNYWDDYTGTYTDSDGIGDTPNQ